MSLLRRKTHSIWRIFAFSLTLYLGATCWNSAFAQSQNRAFQLQQFRPWGDPQGVIMSQSGETLGQWNYFVGLYFNYANQPLTVRSGGNITSIMEHQVGADIVGGVGLLSWLDVALAIPMTLYQVGTVPNGSIFDPSDRGQSLTGFAMSDIKLQLKFQALREKKHVVNLGFQAFVTFPTGNKDLMGGEDPVSFGVKAYLSKRISIVNLALNVGYRFLPPTTFGPLKVQNELTYSLGASFRVVQKYLDVMVDFAGAAALSDTTSIFAVPLEAYVGARAFPLGNDDLALTLGASFAITSGYGAPLFRVLFGIMWAPRKRDKDTDGDGLMDSVDKCPKTPGPRDNKGCPWPDTDGDGLKDNVDKCPKTPGPQDNKGCPWPDTDGDGLTDNVDKCPKKAGPRENKGCPYGDRDGDGLKDNVDKCPDKAGPKENKGCPDKDRDKDSVVDRLDKCPDVPGVKELKGCPRKILVEVRKKKITILQKIEFAFNSSKIRKRSYSILDQVVSVLRSRPNIRIRIEGHTDNVGKPSYNLQLSKRRAASVRRYLVKKGIDASRLDSEGYGETKPLEPNTTTENRAKNRRVQFTILGN